MDMDMATRFKAELGELLPLKCGRISTCMLFQAVNDPSFRLAIDMAQYSLRASLLEFRFIVGAKSIRLRDLCGTRELPR